MTTTETLISSWCLTLPYTVPQPPYLQPTPHTILSGNFTALPLQPFPYSQQCQSPLTAPPVYSLTPMTVDTFINGLTGTVYTSAATNTSVMIRMTLANGQTSYYQGFTIGTYKVPYVWVPEKKGSAKIRVTPEIVVSGRMTGYDSKVIRGV